MRLIGEISRRVVDAVLQQRMPRRDQRGQIRHRATADEQTARGGWESANSTEPAHHSQFDRGRGRSAEPGAVEDVEAGGERVRHCADKIVRSRNESKKARMIDMQVVWKNIALELCE